MWNNMLYHWFSELILGLNKIILGIECSIMQSTWYYSITVSSIIFIVLKATINIDISLPT